MKTHTLFLMLSVSMVISGCAYKAEQPSAPVSWFFECKPYIEYVPEPYEVKIPVQSCIPPKTFCSSDGSLRQGTLNELLMCITALRNSNNKCKEK